jgi:hypothetical protein
MVIVMDNVFINIALDAALKKYLLFKEKRDYSLAGDFLVYVVGILSYIYSEADIINPFLTHDSNTFEHNLLKFNLNHDDLNKFYQDLSSFYELNIKNKVLDYENKNPFFTYVQEDIIKMFLMKYQNTNLEKIELENFGRMLYSSKNSSEYLRNYNKIMTTDEDYILNYYNSKIYSLTNNLTFVLEKDNILDMKVYEAFGINQTDIDKLTQQDLNSINAQILNYYHYSIIEPNLNNKLIEAIAKSKPSTIDMPFLKKNQMSMIIFIILFFIAFIVSGILIGLKLMGK